MFENTEEIGDFIAVLYHGRVFLSIFLEPERKEEVEDKTYEVLMISVHTSATWRSGHEVTVLSQKRRGMSEMNVWAFSSAAWPDANVKSALITVLTPYRRSNGMPA
jgi:hypothetical protein